MNIWRENWKPYTALLLGVVAILMAAWYVVPVRGAEKICGVASWYGGLHHGRKTASGETFNQWAMTAAMPSLARMGETWRVTFKRKSVDVKITDFGPHKSLNRVIDLSRGAAREIGLEHAGVGRVCMVRLR
jgi:rare lipoprotein A